jgi:hypothetical protein
VVVARQAWLVRIARDKKQERWFLKKDLEYNGLLYLKNCCQLGSIKTRCKRNDGEVGEKVFFFFRPSLYNYVLF